MDKIRLSLAPIAGFSDRAFRTLCKECGADLVYTEMISAKAVAFGDKKTHALADFAPVERPIIFQVFGREPEDLSRAVALLYERCEPDGFDLNCGCPVPKVVKSGEGSELMREPKRIEKLVRAMVAASPARVSVKLRTGIDDAHKNALICARAAEDGGASLVTVHGRTRAGMFSAPIDYDTIASVRGALSIPVCANGGIRDEQSARETIERTGCTELMIARGALGDPAIFTKLQNALNGENRRLPDPKTLLLRHLSLACAYKPLRQALPELRGQLQFYFKNKSGSARARERLMRSQSREEIRDVIEDYFKDDLSR